MSAYTSAFPPNWSCLGEEDLTNAEMASAVSPAAPKGTKAIVFQVFAYPVYRTCSGSTPSATVGLTYYPGTGDVIYTNNPKLVKFLRTTSSGGTVNLEFWGE